MKHTRLTIIFSCTAIGLACVSHVVAQSWVIEHYGGQHGLASPDVWAIYQDSRYLLWAGTATGISAFDGNTFTNYTHTEDGHRLGKISSITEDADGRLWIASHQGVFFWHAGAFYILADLEPRVNVLRFDQTGILWLGCLDGLYFIRPGQLDSLVNRDL